MSPGWLALAGLVVGLLGRAVLPRGRRLGVVLTAVLGAAGALLAAWAGTALGGFAPGGPPMWICAALGSLLLVGLAGRLLG